MTAPATTCFIVEPWSVREIGVDLERLGQTESVFALSNGHIGWRGNLDEGEPHVLPGTYLNSFFEQRPLPYAEGGYGYPESGETIINVTNGKVMRLLVDDEPFDVRYGTVHEHERCLDLRAGTLNRKVSWCSPAHRDVLIRSTRLVSLTQRAIAAICYEVEAVDEPLRVVVQSELVANEAMPDLGADPRVSAALESPLVAEASVADEEGGAVLAHRTRASGRRMAVGMRHDVAGPGGTKVETDARDDLARATIATQLEPGEVLRVVKLVGYGWSSNRSLPAVQDQVVAALAAARLAGWDGLVDEQRALLDDFWANADVEVDGDPEVQQAVRFALFNVLQASIRAEGRPIPAKGLTGPGYDGHAFWDTEAFVLPLLAHLRPDAAADALRWRHRTLPIAQARAVQLGLSGAAFPWRTIEGPECSTYWPAGTAAFHVNADIAAAVVRYLEVTGDADLERDVAVELLVATARLWRSLGHHDIDGHFRIDGVTGPDEYSAIVDNNTYTNLLAQQNLRAAAELALRHADVAARLDVTAEEAAAWRDAATNIVVPRDERLGIHEQHEGFCSHAPWDFEHTTDDQYPLLLHYPYFDLYRKQVVKQADLVLAMHACPDAFTPEEKLRNFDYYDAITVRDSSLSAATQAVIAAEVGHLELAHDYLGETALLDLRDLERNTRDGLHLACLAGVWSAVVAGFGGMRVCAGELRFAPRLPRAIEGLRFRLGHRGSCLLVEVKPDHATYRLLGGDGLDISHHGEHVQVGTEPVTRAIPVLPPRPRPKQPPGRAPSRRAGTRGAP
jgi:alpha,alpha-trehalose phosphorylase